MKKFNQKRENRFPFMHRFLTGLIIALSLTLTAFEWTTITTGLTIFPANEIVIDEDDLILPPVTYRKQAKKPVLNKKNTTEIDIVKELTSEETPKEDVIEEKPSEEKPGNEDLSLLSNVDLDQYGEGEDFSYEDENRVHVNVEIFAHYESCSHLVGEELMECSILEISNRIKREFEISPQLKDIGGRQAANLFFVVDKEGNIHSIKALASSSKAIERDAIRAIKKLPQLNPAMQQGRTVQLQMTIPIQVHIRD